MKFGDTIKMLRDYDLGRFAKGETYEVAMGEPEDGKIRPGIAKSLCREGADGQGPYAEIVDDSTNDQKEEA